MPRGPRHEPATTAEFVKRRKLYPVREAAELLGMGRSTLYARAGEGQIEILKVGGRAYVAETELDRFIAAAERADIAAG